MNEENNLNSGNNNVEGIGVGLPPEVPSHEENKEKLAESLHKASELPNLRTYQGDIAQFIKSKDQSVTDVVLKEQARKQEQKEEEEKERRSYRQSKKERSKYESSEQGKAPRKLSFLPNNLIIYAVSLSLVLGAILTTSYLLIVRRDGAPLNVESQKKIISTKETVIFELSSLTPTSMKENMANLRKSPEYKNGLTAIKVSDSSKKNEVDLNTLSKVMNFNMPASLLRTLGGSYALGLYGNEESNFYFIFKIKDYGIAFRDMLVWEETMLKNFDTFLIPVATSTATNGYEFKDLIVRNKDTRAAVNRTGKVRLLYTFMDKETILITESEGALKGLIDAYVVGDTVR